MTITPSLLAWVSSCICRHHFLIVYNILFCLGSMIRVQYPKCAYCSYWYFNPIWNTICKMVYPCKYYLFSYLLHRLGVLRLCNVTFTWCLSLIIEMASFSISCLTDVLMTGAESNTGDVDFFGSLNLHLVSCAYEGRNSSATKTTKIHCLKNSIDILKILWIL